VRARPTIELAGGLLVGAAVTVEIGAIAAAADSGFGDSVSIGDFFAALGVFQLFVVTLVVLGVLLLSATPLLAPATMTTTGGASRLILLLAMVVGFVGVVFAVGATITSLARLGDDELGVSAGDWLLGAGAALGAAGAVVLTAAALGAGRRHP